MSETIDNRFSQKVILTGRLEEFRSALEEEIKSARLDAFGHTVPLVSGRRISNVGKSYQYVFRLKDTLNLPDDAPGDLYIQNRQPIEVTIVAVDGMSIILSCKNDMGEYIPEARLFSDLTFLLKKLIERIEELTGFSNIVGDRILSNMDVVGEPTSIEQPELNERQLEALKSCVGRNLTFVWGPPGTGKTRTIGYIGCQLRLEKKSLLIVSHTNTAIDQALIKIADLTDSVLLDEGKILRIGIPKDKRIPDKYPNILLETHVERRSKELSNRLKYLRIELDESREYVKKLISDIELYDWFSIAKNDFNEMAIKMDRLTKTDIELDKARTHYVELKKESIYWDNAKSDALEANKNITQIEQLDSQILQIAGKVDQLSFEKDQHHKTLIKAKQVLSETQSVNWIIRIWRSLPSPEDQRRLVDELLFIVNEVSENFEKLSNELRSLELNREQLTEEVSKFKENYSDDPDEIIQQEKVIRNDLNQLVNHGTSLRNEYDGFRISLSRYFRERLSIIQSLGFVGNGDGTVYELFNLIGESFHKIQSYIETIDIEKSRSELQTTFERIKEIETEIASIENALSRIEELIISEADIIATTLTRAYLNDTVRSRRYDTIIIDEASMAPIPSIWVAASLIDNNAVIVGDPKQLPPIVISNNEIAKKWLGRDIFSVSGVDKSCADNIVKLNEQYRMHRDIAEIPNHLFYNGEWIYSYKNDEAGYFSKWYNIKWENDVPVLLIDTGPLNAWVTSVPRGKSSSRLNFLSATLCIDLCNILLKKDRPKREIDRDERRIFIQSPYQPHAKFLNILLEENKLHEDVEVGTIHTFQGSEADVVIFDLVNDEPHWRVGLFMPSNDENTKKLINVCITRARRRLFVVGDFSYIEGLSKKAFLGRDFIPFLKDKFPIKSALDVVPLGLFMRAAEARKLISKGKIESDSTRIIVTQDDFYPLLLDDIDSAKKKVVIYSPFMTQNRMAELQPTFLSAKEKGVRVFVITKPLQERGKRSQEQFRYLEHNLEDWGVTVIHKRGMHEKLIIIDDNILWSGSLNPLSYSDTQEIMERRVSKTVIQEYSKIIRLDKLVEEFIKGTPRCPICESEMIASEGRDDPYYWRCVVDNCYSRSIDQPQIQGGIIVCSTCGCDVEFGQWGNKPNWRCIDNKRHHQRIIRSHLKLPKMKKKIPIEQIPEMEKMFGVTISEMKS